MPQLKVYVTYNNDGDQGVGDDEGESEERYTDNFSGRYRTIAVNVEAPEIPSPTEVAVTVPEEKAGPAHADPADLDGDEDEELIDQHNRDIDPAKEAGA